MKQDARQEVVGQNMDVSVRLSRNLCAAAGSVSRNRIADFFSAALRRSRTLSALRYHVLFRSLILRGRRHLTRRQRVAIGPVRGLPDDAVVGPRVLLIADWINRRSAHFDADLFFHSSDVLKRHYEALIIVKDFDDFTFDQLERLKARGTRLIYSIADNPGGGHRSYHDEPQFLDYVDAIIAANPLQIEDLEEHRSKAHLIPAPIRNTTYKRSYGLKKPARLIWQGYVENAGLTEWLHPLIEELNLTLPGGVELVYHANRPPPTGGAIRFEQWRPETWERELIESDIAIAVKPPENWLQSRKPPTKVLTYLAGALPVVCTPSEADKIVVRHGENSLVAHSIDEWREALLLLLKDESLRRRLAHRGQRDALAFASRTVVGRAHQRLLLSLTGGAGWRKL